MKKKKKKFDTLEREFYNNKQEAEKKGIILPKIEDSVVIDEKDQDIDVERKQKEKIAVDKTQKAEIEKQILEKTQKLFQELLKSRSLKERLSRDPNSLTKAEQKQLEILEHKFNAKKKEPEEKGIIPRLQDFVVDDNDESYNQKIPISDAEKQELEQKIRKIKEEIFPEIVIIRKLQEKSP